ncbi:hypothetical protein A5621_16845 [Mycobacterium colombiense]|uniref:hypothetical protein n=1 Tax=Mycobacterium colombiense TaxID=339268 RepID=UPI0007FCE672|nr:hypothetical protein [Mycobacterium colombiense]OBJ35685.1 hypothetical protein A5621_16845 [Mycobacterium colombiense]
MVQTTRHDALESSEHLHAMAQAVLAGQRAEQPRQAAEVARRLAADSVQAAAASLALSAQSQDRTAQAFEDAADRGGRRCAFLRAHAAEHRRFAEEDRRMAQELQQNGRNWLAMQARLDRWMSRHNLD